MGLEAALAAGIGLSGLQSAFGNISEGVTQSIARKSQSDFRAQQLEFNKKFANLQAKDAIAREQKAERQLREQGRQLIGAQRAAIAGQNIQVDAGTAGALTEDTQRQVDEAALELRNNAWREAWGFKAEATGLESAARFQRLSGDFGARSTLISGGIRAVSSIFQSGTQALKGIG